MLAIDDPDLPGLAHLTQARLCAMTGLSNVSLLRLRYRARERAVLHLAGDAGSTTTEGALWFFKGDKARRLAGKNAAARYDPDSMALFEVFPNDHRMPQIGDFLARYAAIAPQLLQGQPDGPPVLLRYRPGLSCTFRCGVRSEAPRYVKLINDTDPARLLTSNRDMTRNLSDGPVAIAGAIATDLSVPAISFVAAGGISLDAALMLSGDLAPLRQVLSALRAFAISPITPGRRMDTAMLLARARQSATLIAVTAPACAAPANAILARLQGTQPLIDLRPIHGDMKLEHVFLDGNQTVLIDTESVSLGPPDYDLAQLDGRLWQAEMQGQLPYALAQAASSLIRATAGPAFGWCLGVVALHLAKYHAQRPAPDMTEKINAILGRLA